MTTQNANELVRDLLSAGRIDEVVALFRRLGPAAGADLLAAAPYEDQQTIFRALPVDLAAKIVSQFPYYHEYVLLHSRPVKEMRSIVDSIDPAERLRFLDELPEEAWQRLMSELAPTTTETSGEETEAQGAAAAPGTRPVAAVEYIIEANGVEKSFQQPDGK